MGDVLQDYPVWRVPLAAYVDTPRKVVALRDISQRVAGWARDQDPVRERRGPRGGGDWRTKAVLAENANNSLAEENKELLRLLCSAQDNDDKTYDSINRLHHDRGQMINDIADIRCELSAARAESKRDKSLRREVIDLRSERDHLRAVLMTSNAKIICSRTYVSSSASVAVLLSQSFSQTSQAERRQLAWRFSVVDCVNLFPRFF